MLTMSNNMKLRVEFIKENIGLLEIHNDYGTTEPTWNYAIWLENKLLNQKLTSDRVKCCTNCRRDGNQSNCRSCWECKYWENCSYKFLDHWELKEVLVK